MDTTSIGVKFTSDAIFCYAVRGVPSSPTYVDHKKFTQDKAAAWTVRIQDGLGYIKAFQEQHAATCGGLVLMHHGSGAGVPKSLNDSLMALLRLEGVTYYVLGNEFSGRLAAGNRKQITKMLGITAPDEILSTTCKEFRNLSNWSKIGVEFKEAGAAAVAGLEKFKI